MLEGLLSLELMCLLQEIAGKSDLPYIHSGLQQDGVTISFLNTPFPFTWTAFVLAFLVV